MSPGGAGQWPGGQVVGLVAVRGITIIRPALAEWGDRLVGTMAAWEVGAMDRDEVWKLFKDGPEGIKEWNRRRGAGEKIPDLTEANLTEADLCGADLGRANLLKAKLGWAVLLKAHLVEADLRKAYLRGADLGGADLGGADLGGADLGGANLRDCNLYDAVLRGADLRKAYLRGADLCGADLRGADLGDCILSGADLRDCNLSGTDLRDCNLSGAVFRGADLRKANLGGALLLGVDLGGARLHGANLNGANLGGADLREADLGGADLRGADLRRADLGGADLGGADLRGADLRRADLGGADLGGADLRRADLGGADLGGADLGGADLGGADLGGATCAQTSFVNADLSKVKGLDSINHRGPSHLSMDTLIRSKGMIPKAFLRGCGVPDAWIADLPSLIDSMAPIQCNSCIISYSSADQSFAERLYADLQARGNRRWFDRVLLKIEGEIRDDIEDSIRFYDILLLVLSAHSVASEWVRNEVETALEKERWQGRLVLFPIRLDDTVMEAEAGWAGLVRRRHIGDFRGWKDHDAYQEAFARLLRDLCLRSVGDRTAAPASGETGSWQTPAEPPPQVEISQVVMTAYYPKEVEPLVWHPLHAYIFRESAASQVVADARERLGEWINEYRRRSETARRPLAMGSTITATPRLEGFQFNPPSQAVDLYEDWHRLDFQLRARPALAGTASNGLLTFTVEGVIVADIPISIYVGDRVMTAEMVDTPGRPYQSIFCSYSRQDTCVVKRVERACKTLGIDYLRDVVSLRSGEPWQPALLSMIERADIFQLFWSRNAVRSKYVEDEWRYALRLGREPSRFIRPVYWTEPMPPPPPELGHLSFAFVPELASLLWQFVSHAYRLVARLTSRSPALSNDWIGPSAGPCDARTLTS